MKNVTMMMAITLASLLGSKAFAVEKTFYCNGGELSVQLDTEPADPENAAGSLDDERLDHEVDLYESPAPAFGNKSTKTYLLQGMGDGDTQFFYMVIPLQLENLTAGSKLQVIKVEKNDQKATTTNPQGITRTAMTCTVGK